MEIRVTNYLNTPLLVQALRKNHEFRNQQLAYNGRRHPHAKVQSVPSKKTGRRYRGLNPGPITCEAKAFTTELQSSCLKWGEFTQYRICEKLDRESVRDCLSGETLMLANHKYDV